MTSQAPYQTWLADLAYTIWTLIRKSWHLWLVTKSYILHLI